MQNAAFRCGLIVLLTVALSSDASAKKHRKIDTTQDPKHNRSHQHHGADPVWPWPITWQSPQATVIPAQHPPAASDYQNANNQPEQPESSGDYNRRSTEAAETQAIYAERQFYIGIGSTLIGVLAAAFTYWAARAAADAAKSADQAVKASTLSLEHERQIAGLNTRPWVSVSAKVVSDLCVRNTEIYCHVELLMENIGNTPAIAIFPFFTALFCLNDNSIEERVATLEWDGDTISKCGYIVYPKKTKSIVCASYFLRTEVSNNKFAKETGHIMPIIRGVIAYKRVGFDDIYTTHFKFSMHLREPHNMAIPAVFDRIPVDNIELTDDGVRTVS